MERGERIFEIAQEIIDEQASLIIERIANEYILKKDEILSDFEKTVKKLIKKAKEQQLNKEKGDIESFTISYLFSSAVTKSYLFKLSLYDKEYYLDPVETTAYWCPKFIFSHIEDDLKCINEAIEKEFIRVQPYELDIPRRGYICQFYNAAAGYFFKETIVNAAITSGISELRLQDNIRFLFGGFMDESVILDIIKKEELV